MAFFKNGWYLIYTRPRQERKVFRELNDLSIPCFLPETQTVKQWNDRMKKQTIPLFPSYVFLNLDNLENYYRAMDVNGFVTYVRFGKHLAIAREETIEDIRLLVDHSRELTVFSGYYKSGQMVNIQNGPLAGRTFEVVEHRRKNVIILRVNLLNQFVLASLSPSDVVLSTEDEKRMPDKSQHFHYQAVS